MFEKLKALSTGKKVALGLGISVIVGVIILGIILLVNYLSSSRTIGVAPTYSDGSDGSDDIMIGSDGTVLNRIPASMSVNEALGMYELADPNSSETPHTIKITKENGKLQAILKISESGTDDEGTWAREVTTVIDLEVTPEFRGLNVTDKHIMLKNITYDVPYAGLMVLPEGVGLVSYSASGGIHLNTSWKRS